MIDKQKIIMMSKLAIYDKRLSDADKKTNDYFLHDYISKKNMWLRIFAFFGVVIVLLFQWLYKILIQGIDIGKLDYQKELLDMGGIVVIVLVGYTIIGILQGTMEYRASQKRIKAYLQLLYKVDHFEEKISEDTKGASDLNDGADIVYTRDNH